GRILRMVRRIDDGHELALPPLDQRLRHFGGEPFNSIRRRFSDGRRGDDAGNGCCRPHPAKQDSAIETWHAFGGSRKRLFRHGIAPVTVYLYNVPTDSDGM